MCNSPCVGICKVNGLYCTGCGRTVEDIADWQLMNDSQRREATWAAEQRLEQMARDAFLGRFRARHGVDHGQGKSADIIRAARVYARVYAHKDN